jgi:hypothetical protein
MTKSLAVLAALCLSCQTAYYGAMEKLGYEKRDILVSRVDSARDAQQEAKEQFEDALQQFIAVTNFSGGALEEQYNNLKGEFEESEERAKDVRKRIDDVERVAADLFAEWSSELDDYANPEMRRASKRQLDATRTRCQKLIGVMNRAEKKLDPVLAAFRDRVLFLKHNLNARAIASLRGERARVESDIGALIADMNRSIAEADSFIKEMSTEQG